MTLDFSNFTNESFPADSTISLGSGIEAKGVEAFFKGKRRWDVSLQQLDEEYEFDPAACLAFMTPAAFAFFLPAFMRIAVADYAQANAIPDAIVYRLAALANGEDEDRLKAITSTYSNHQLGLVRDFLLEMSELNWKYMQSDIAMDAIKKLWGRV